MFQQELQPQAWTAQIRRQKEGACMQQVQVRQVQVKNKSCLHPFNPMQKLDDGRVSKALDHTFVN
jgi:hypothetical protein